MTIFSLLLLFTPFTISGDDFTWLSKFFDSTGSSGESQRNNLHQMIEKVRMQREDLLKLQGRIDGRRMLLPIPMKGLTRSEDEVERAAELRHLHTSGSAANQGGIE